MPWHRHWHLKIIRTVSITTAISNSSPRNKAGNSSSSLSICSKLISTTHQREALAASIEYALLVGRLWQVCLDAHLHGCNMLAMCITSVLCHLFTVSAFALPNIQMGIVADFVHVA